MGFFSPKGGDKSDAPPSDDEPAVREELELPFSPGATLGRIPDQGEEMTDPATSQAFCNGDASRFRTRVGPDYSKNKQKEPSGQSFYNLASFDLICRKNGRIRNVVENNFLALDPDWVVDTGHPSVPPVLIVNIQLPHHAPSLTGRDNETDFSYSQIYVFKISDETLTMLQTPEDNWPPALKLLIRWMELKSDTDEIHKRFKAIVSVRDVEQIASGGNLSRLVNAWNAKPVLIHKTGHFVKGENYIEYGIDFFQFGYQARWGLSLVSPKFQDVIVDVGFVIEGKENSELPEVIFGCATCVRCDRNLAPAVKESDSTS